MPVTVLTGATSGIGRPIAAGLAAAGHHLVIIARDPARADALRASLPGVPIDLVAADLSSLADTRRAAETIAARHPAIDVLIANAGLFATRRETTSEGVERVLATNHLSPVVLILSLAGALAAARGRVVVTGSSTSDRARLDPADLELARGWAMKRAYAGSKLAVMAATFTLAERLRGQGVIANVVHPGAVATSLVRAGGPIGIAWRLMRPFLLTPEQGADTPLHVALSPEWAGRTGLYVKRRAPAPPNPRALDAAFRDAVWASTLRLIDRASPTP